MSAESVSAASEAVGSWAQAQGEAGSPTELVKLLEKRVFPSLFALNDGQLLDAACRSHQGLLQTLREITKHEWEDVRAAAILPAGLVQLRLWLLLSDNSPSNAPHVMSQLEGFLHEYQSEVVTSSIDMVRFKDDLCEMILEDFTIAAKMVADAVPLMVSSSDIQSRTAAAHLAAAAAAANAAQVPDTSLGANSAAPTHPMVHVDGNVSLLVTVLELFNGTTQSLSTWSAALLGSPLQSNTLSARLGLLGKSNDKRSSLLPLVEQVLKQVGRNPQALLQCVQSGMTLANPMVALVSELCHLFISGLKLIRLPSGENNESVVRIRSQFLTLPPQESNLFSSSTSSEAQDVSQGFVEVLPFVSQWVHTVLLPLLQNTINPQHQLLLVRDILRSTQHPLLQDLRRICAMDLFRYTMSLVQNYPIMRKEIVHIASREEILSWSFLLLRQMAPSAVAVGDISRWPYTEALKHLELTSSVNPVLGTRMLTELISVILDIDLRYSDRMIEQLRGSVIFHSLLSDKRGKVTYQPSLISLILNDSLRGNDMLSLDPLVFVVSNTLLATLQQLENWIGVVNSFIDNSTEKQPETINKDSLLELNDLQNTESDNSMLESTIALLERLGDARRYVSDRVATGDQPVHSENDQQSYLASRFGYLDSIADKSSLHAAAEALNALQTLQMKSYGAFNTSLTSEDTYVTIHGSVLLEAFKLELEALIEHYLQVSEMAVLLVHQWSAQWGKIIVGQYFVSNLATVKLSCYLSHQFLADPSEVKGLSLILSLHEVSQKEYASRAEIICAIDAYNYDTLLTSSVADAVHLPHFQTIVTNALLHCIPFSVRTYGLSNSGYSAIFSARISSALLFCTKLLFLDVDRANDLETMAAQSSVGILGDAFTLTAERSLYSGATNVQVAQVTAQIDLFTLILRVFSSVEAAQPMLEDAFWNLETTFLFAALHTAIQDASITRQLSSVWQSSRNPEEMVAHLQEIRGVSLDLPLLSSISVLREKLAVLLREARAVLPFTARPLDSHAFDSLFRVWLFQNRFQADPNLLRQLPDFNTIESSFTVALESITPPEELTRPTAPSPTHDADDLLSINEEAPTAQLSIGDRLNKFEVISAALAAAHHQHDVLVPSMFSTRKYTAGTLNISDITAIWEDVFNTHAFNVVKAISPSPFKPFDSIASFAEDSSFTQLSGADDVLLVMAAVRSVNPSTRCVSVAVRIFNRTHMRVPFFTVRLLLAGALRTPPTDDLHKSTQRHISTSLVSIAMPEGIFPTREALQHNMQHYAAQDSFFSVGVEYFPPHGIFENTFSCQIDSLQPADLVVRLEYPDLNRNTETFPTLCVIPGQDPVANDFLVPLRAYRSIGKRNYPAFLSHFENVSLHPKVTAVVDSAALHVPCSSLFLPYGYGALSSMRSWSVDHLVYDATEKQIRSQLHLSWDVFRSSWSRISSCYSVQIPVLCPLVIAPNATNITREMLVKQVQESLTTNLHTVLREAGDVGHSFFGLDCLAIRKDATTGVADVCGWVLQSLWGDELAVMLCLQPSGSINVGNHSTFGLMVDGECGLLPTSLTIRSSSSEALNAVTRDLSAFLDAISGQYFINVTL